MDKHGKLMFKGRIIMAVSEEYLDFVLEQLECVGPVVPKRMFGGVGLYLDGIFFALIADNILRFKVDGSNRKDFECRGMEAFRPYPHKPTTMQYYEVPIEVLEDQEALQLWAEKALEVARRKKEKNHDILKPNLACLPVGRAAVILACPT